MTYIVAFLFVSTIFAVASAQISVTDCDSAMQHGQGLIQGYSDLPQVANDLPTFKRRLIHIDVKATIDALLVYRDELADVDRNPTYAGRSYSRFVHLAKRKHRQIGNIIHKLRTILQLVDELPRLTDIRPRHGFRSASGCCI